MKKIYVFRLALLSAIAVAFHGCDVMWDTAVDGGDGGFYYGDYPGYSNNWWPVLPGSPAFPPYPGVNSYYPDYYPGYNPPYSPAPPRPNRPATRPPQWNGNGEPGPVINIGNVRPGNSGNGNQQRPPANVNQGNNGNTRPPFTLTPSRLPDTDNGNNGQRPGRH